MDEERNLCIGEFKHMKNLISLNEITKSDVENIFKIADNIQSYQGALKGKTIVLFFPSSSIRTRVTFEKGVHQLGAQVILFPSDTLDKKEDIRDVMGYLDNWADGVIVRYKDIQRIEKMAQTSSHTVINAMTNVNHPCEVLSDLYALSKLRNDYLTANYLFVGATGNIGLAWKEAAQLLGLNLKQSCPKGFEMEGIGVITDLDEAIIGQDIILTDPLPSDIKATFANHMITLERMKKANENALLNPCPPFARGEEVSSDVIDSEYFVGYGFKKDLLTVQQAIIVYCMGL